MCHKNQFPVASCQLPAKLCGDGRLARPAFYFFFAADFLAAFLGAAFFFALAGFSSPSCSSSCAAAAFFTLGCFFASSGALKLCPSNAISVIRTAVYDCRCPRSFLYCFLRL